MKSWLIGLKEKPRIQNLKRKLAEKKEIYFQDPRNKDKKETNNIL